MRVSPVTADRGKSRQLRPSRTACRPAGLLVPCMHIDVDASRARIIPRRKLTQTRAAARRAAPRGAAYVRENYVNVVVSRSADRRTDGRTDADTQQQRRRRWCSRRRALMGRVVRCDRFALFHDCDESVTAR